MTRKSKLSAWAESLGAVSAAESANMTAAQLEAAIENAIVTPSESQPQFTLRDGIAANLAVLRSELPSTARAVIANLRGVSSHAN
jgi:predicted glycosyltransferase